MYITFDAIVESLNFNVKGVIHVGAHLGEEVPSYQRFTNNIHVFEPLKDCLDKITDSVNKYNYALGDVEEEKIFYLADNNQSSSLLKPKLHIDMHPTVQFVGEKKMQIKTLDSFNIIDSNFLNMDVQGYELNVLKGATNTLKYIDAIYTEINLAELYENNVLLAEMDSWLKERGFERVWQHITPHSWGDALYVRK